MLKIKRRSVIDQPQFLLPHKHIGVTDRSVYIQTLLRKNFLAFMLNHVIIVAGFVLAGACTWLFSKSGISPFWWMTLTGLGLYMVYIPFNAVFFERMISSFRFTGNVGFLIYIADSFGYFGSVAVLFTKEIFKVQLNWVQFFSNSVMLLSIAGVALTTYSAYYFWRKEQLLFPKEKKNERLC